MDNKDVVENAAHQEWIDDVMAAVQEYACTWSAVGGPFDAGDTLEEAMESKQRIVKILQRLPIVVG